MRYIDYLTANNQTGEWDAQCKIDTGIPMTGRDITITIQYKPKYASEGWTFCDRIVGYAPIYDFPQGSGYIEGMRLFGWSGGTFDCNNRWSNLGLVEQGRLYDLTITTDYIFDNTAGDMVLELSYENPVAYPVGTDIFIDVSWTEIYGLRIEGSSGILLDGRPAVDDEGHIGLWDEVSQTLVYNPDLDMYDPNPVDCTDCANWQECGYESYEDCQCQQYGECPPDCTDCNNWADCGYESYEDCQCQQYGEDCPPDCTDCNNWEECGYESYDDCRCQQYGECPEPPVPVVPHLKIVETLKDILEGMVSDTDCALQSWQYNKLSKANVRLDTKMPSPTALFIEITDFKIEMDKFTKKELAHVFVSFLDKESKLDDEGLNEDTIIANMSELAIDFILRIKEERTLRIKNDVINLKSVFYQSDSNRTGVTVELDLETLPTCITK